jgi:hypothetical protein
MQSLRLHGSYGMYSGDATHDERYGPAKVLFWAMNETDCE